MAKAEVKCLYCGKTFDRNSEDYVKPNERRYAHKECYENRSPEEKAKDEIFLKTKKWFGEDYDKKKITFQLNRYLNDGKTALNILKALEYFYIEKGNSFAQANGGIGIIPYIYDEAIEYWETKDKIKNRKVQKDETEFKVRKIKIKREPVKQPVNINFFHLD